MPEMASQDKERRRKATENFVSMLDRDCQITYLDAKEEIYVSSSYGLPSITYMLDLYLPGFWELSSQSNWIKISSSEDALVQALNTMQQETATPEQVAATKNLLLCLDPKLRVKVERANHRKFVYVSAKDPNDEKSILAFLNQHLPRGKNGEPQSTKSGRPGSRWIKISASADDLQKAIENTGKWDSLRGIHTYLPDAKEPIKPLDCRQLRESAMFKVAAKPKLADWQQDWVHDVKQLIGHVIKKSSVGWCKTKQCPLIIIPGGKFPLRIVTNFLKNFLGDESFTVDDGVIKIKVSDPHQLYGARQIARDHPFTRDRSAGCFTYMEGCERVSQFESHPKTIAFAESKMPESLLAQKELGAPRQPDAFYTRLK